MKSILADACDLVRGSRDDFEYNRLELARTPELQFRLRSEKRHHQSAAHTRNGTQFTTSDLGNMLHLNAVVKEETL